MPDSTDLLAMTADIVASHVANNSVDVGDLPTLISNVYISLSGLGSTPEPVVAKQEPAVSIRGSVKPDYIVCLEDGKKLKMLKRHLMTKYSMTPDAYRSKWGLPSDYPMVAPNYAERRRSLAIKIGLGNKRDATPAPAPLNAPPVRDEAASPLPEATPKTKRGRPAKHAADAATSPPVPKPARRRKVIAAVGTDGS